GTATGAYGTGSAVAQTLLGERDHASLGEVGRRVGEEVDVQEGQSAAARAAGQVEHVGEDSLHALDRLGCAAETGARKFRSVFAVHRSILSPGEKRRHISMPGTTQNVPSCRRRCLRAMRLAWPSLRTAASSSREAWYASQLELLIP